MDRYRVAILGTSFGRTVHAPGFQRHTGFEVVAIAGSEAEKVRRVAGELGIPAAYADWQHLLEEVKPDVVSIATPADLHHPMMLAALERGASVLCEKPTALTRWHAAEMRDRAAALGRVAAIDHEFRFFPARAFALALTRRGDIGTPRRGEILGRYPIWARPESRGMSWLSRLERGGGVLGALGSHHTDCLRLFFGEPVSALASVRVGQPQRGSGAGGGVATADDACTVHYAFEHGASAIVDLDAAVPYRWERFEIHGSEATLRWDETGYRLWRIAVGKEPEELAIPAEHKLEPRAGDSALLAPFGVLVERLYRALRGQQPMEPDFDDAVAVQSALDAARASGESGAVVRVEIPPPAKHAG
ncbi:MAG TPA: Gfo/Idh/MocA family oxidoreductase [Candidatus Eisenbacteria bacterium]